MLVQKASTSFNVTREEDSLTSAFSLRYDISICCTFFVNSNPQIYIESFIYYSVNKGTIILSNRRR